MNSVTGKIQCIFTPQVVESVSNKRHNQSYKVVASNHICPEVLACLETDIFHATVKLDGTACYVGEFNGRPWLWARHDVKPNKVAEKRFKAYQHEKKVDSLNSTEEFAWDIQCDFKTLPDDWIPAKGCKMSEIRPDSNGHLVGWIPVDPSSRQHVWHLSTVDLNNGHFVSLVQCEQGELVVQVKTLREYNGKTFELIGTKVNNNSYGLGSKADPLHLLVQHGEIKLKSLPKLPASKDDLLQWFRESNESTVEGIVWHTTNDTMFKIHRHHLELPWPVKDSVLSNISINMAGYTKHYSCRNNVFERLLKIDRRQFNNLANLFGVG